LKKKAHEMEKSTQGKPPKLIWREPVFHGGDVDKKEPTRETIHSMTYRDESEEGHGKADQEGREGNDFNTI